MIIKTRKDKQRPFIYFILAMFMFRRIPYALRMLFNSNITPT